MNDNPIINGQPIYPGELHAGQARIDYRSGLLIEAQIRYPGIGRLGQGWKIVDGNFDWKMKPIDLEHTYRFRLSPAPAQEQPAEEVEGVEEMMRLAWNAATHQDLTPELLAHAVKIGNAVPDVVRFRLEIKRGLASLTPAQPEALRQERGGQ